ncbi:hypothetical protein NC652_006879 [Populus alba x Populus x berolinensis]|nr:hypothetical protein NC652_006879 [Populus alba x Populus x berolinensis]
MVYDIPPESFLMRLPPNLFIRFPNLGIQTKIKLINVKKCPSTLKWWMKCLREKMIYWICIPGL